MDFRTACTPSVSELRSHSGEPKKQRRRDDDLIGHRLWQNLLDRSKILCVKSLRPSKKTPLRIQALNGGGYEELETDKPSQRVCDYPVGLDSRKTSMADESGLRGSMQLPSVLSLLFQSTRRAPALRVQH